MATRDTYKRLKPAGHSAAIESLIQPAIVVGSTLMSAIAAYVLALDNITRLLNGRGQPADIFITALCAGMGWLIDMAIIVSATRYKMHAVRADPREAQWRTLAKWVLIVGLTSEAMTLFYFFVHLDPAAFPPFLIWLANIIHAVLAVSRAFLPPVVIAYFAAGVLPVTFDRSDRNREIKSLTSTNIITLIGRLARVKDTDDTAEQLRALGGQLMLDTYATYDVTARTTEEAQLHRDGKLLAHIARIHRLDWDSIAEDVAPELAAPTAKRQEGQEDERQEERQPSEAPAPAQLPYLPLPPQRAPQQSPQAPQAPRRAPAAPPEEPPALAPAAQRNTRTAARNQRRGLGRTGLPARTLAALDDIAADDMAADDEPPQTDRAALRARREEAARRILAADPDLSSNALARQIAIATHNRIGESTARELRNLILGERLGELNDDRPPLHIVTDLDDTGEEAMREN